DVLKPTMSSSFDRARTSIIATEPATVGGPMIGSRAVHTGDTGTSGTSAAVDVVGACVTVEEADGPDGLASGCRAPVHAAVRTRTRARPPNAFLMRGTLRSRRTSQNPRIAICGKLPAGLRVRAPEQPLEDLPR